MMMRPSEYLRARAECIYEGKWFIGIGPLHQDWRPYVVLTMPNAEERYGPTAGNVEDHVLRLCLAAAIAESEGQ
jgi:hypothetical protein